MNDQKWKYKITGGFTGVILSVVLLAVFCGIVHMFPTDQSGPGMLCGILILFALLASVLALYRAVFFKVLIDRDGFYFQSAPGNGRYFQYSEIKRMWISTGRETNSNETSYCNFETSDGAILRFFFTGADEKAVDYLIKQVETAKKVDKNKFIDDHREHIVSGKVQGPQRIAVVLFIFLILLLMTGAVVKEGWPPVIYVLPILLSVVAVALEMIHYFCFRILIQKDGFYCRTNPFDGKYYAFGTVRDCRLVEKRKKFGSAFRRGTRKTRYFYILVFTDSTNTTRKILYNKALFEVELNILLSRMKRGQDRADQSDR